MKSGARAASVASGLQLLHRFVLAPATFWPAAFGSCPQACARSQTHSHLAETASLRETASSQRFTVLTSCKATLGPGKPAPRPRLPMKLLFLERSGFSGFGSVFPHMACLENVCCLHLLGPTEVPHGEVLWWWKSCASTTGEPGVASGWQWGPLGPCFGAPQGAGKAWKEGSLFKR